MVNNISITNISVIYKYKSMANSFLKTNNQYNAPNVKRWVISSQLPNLHKIFKTRINNGCNNGYKLSNSEISIIHSK